MQIALISDTHGQIARTRMAIERMLQAPRVEAVLHSGDIGSTEVLTLMEDHLASIGIPVHAVAGNVDEWDPAVLRHRGSIRVARASFEYTADGKRFFLIHGHDENALESAIASGRYAYVIHGHTHQRRDERIGRTRVINPGAIQRSPQPGFARLDTETDTLKFIDLPL